MIVTYALKTTLSVQMQIVPTGDVVHTGRHVNEYDNQMYPYTVLRPNIMIVWCSWHITHNVRDY